MYNLLFDSPQTSHFDAERLAYTEVLKLWQHFFNAQSEEFPTRQTVLTHIGKISAKYLLYKKTWARRAKYKYSKQVQKFQEIKSFLESVFAPCLTFSPKKTIFPSFKEWDQKQSKFELDLGFAVLKIPNFDNILIGVEVSSACFEAESPEPSCQMVKSDNFFEACEL